MPAVRGSGSRVDRIVELPILEHLRPDAPVDQVADVLNGLSAGYGEARDLPASTVTAMRPPPRAVVLISTIGKRLLLIIDAPQQARCYGVSAVLGLAYLKSRGAKSFRQRRHVSHSCAVPGDSEYTFLIPA